MSAASPEGDDSTGGPIWPSEEELAQAPPAIEEETITVPVLSYEAGWDKATKNRLLFLRSLVHDDIISEEL